MLSPGTAVGLGGRVSLVRFSACVLIFDARVNQSLMADEEVAACKCLCAYFANERLFFGMSSNVSLQMFLLPSSQ